VFTATGGIAAARTWTGAVSTDWSTAGNWSPAGAPGATDSVVVPSAPGNQPVLHSAAVAIGSLVIANGAVVTLDTSTLAVQGDFTNAGTLSDPASTSTLAFKGAGRSLAGSAAAALATITGSYTLTGALQATNLQIQGSLTLGGHRADVSASLATGGLGIVAMTNAADTLSVAGDVGFAGGNTTGDLTAGVLLVGGNFAQTSVVTGASFAAGPGLTTIFNGTKTQTVAFADSVSSSLGTVSVTNPAGVVFASIAIASGDLTVASGATLTATDLSFATGTGLSVQGNVTSQAGSLLELGRLYVRGVLSVNGTFNTTAIIFTGAGQTIPAGLPYQYLYVGGGTVTFAPGAQSIANQIAVQGGSLTLNQNISFGGNTFLQLAGTLVLNGHTLSTANLYVESGAFLEMTNPLDTLIAAGDASFAGGNSSGRLTAGGIYVGGQLTQTVDPQAFVSSGTHTVILDGGGVQTVHFDNPGTSGASHFQNLVIANPQGAAAISSDVWVLGQVAFAPGLPRFVSGSGQTVHLANLNITGATFSNVLVAYDAALGGSLSIAMDSVTFQSYPLTGADLITIAHPGAVNPLTGGAQVYPFSNLTFLSVIGQAGGTSNYIRATDSDGATPVPLMIQITSNLVNTEGLAHTVQNNGASVSWP
jgi:hypothetical protein